jgi:Family of unknown function (DUF5946)
MPAVPPTDATEACPGCGSVLAPVTGPGFDHPGASPSCARLFEVTVHGLREEAEADPGTAAVLRQAEAAYDAQHPSAGDPARLGSALAALGAPSQGDLGNAAPPDVWRTTIADVAADLDVIDLAVLIDAWARAVEEDWSARTDRIASYATGDNHGQ